MNDCKKCDSSLEAFMIDETPKLMVRGKEIGINDLDQIMKDVHAAGTSEERLGLELLERVKRMDYVPPSMEKDYSAALVQDYRRRFG
jgi:hypothetical protein